MNPCGDCTACCDSLGFTHDNWYTRQDPDIILSQKVALKEGIKYDWGSGCNKLCSKSGDCKIYEKRPHVCRSFDCGYLKYDLDLETRPDQCGFITEVNDGWIMVTPWLHGQRGIDIDKWRVENHESVKDVLGDISQETGVMYKEYMLQSYEKSYWVKI
jgi:hypothetical protein